ncbi:MAG TPA: DoxX family membrane protein [Chloroflexota bacterium]|nr:DoxX family membrane protein [Chloroflexota bacterium]
MALNAVVNPREIKDPPVAQFLFGSTRMAIVWLAVRLFVGYQWINSGWGKFNNPKWTETGEALQGFWVSATKIPEAPAKAAITFDWYRSFLQYLLEAQAYTWFSKLIVAGELLVGIALILGVFTGIAAFFGGLMNFNFMLAGSASSNPLLFAMAIGLMLAWKVAGHYGLDAIVLRSLGTPWQLGPLVKKVVPLGIPPVAPARPAIA